MVDVEKIIDRTTEYALKVVNKKIEKGDTETACCKRHLDDLEKSEGDWDYYFDVEEAEKYIDISNELKIAEGEEEVKLKTRGFQNFIIGSIHGWKKKSNNALRYREGYIQLARQNSKSFLAGVEANNFSTFRGYKLGKVYCAATKQDQANIVWDELAKFIRSDKWLDKMYKVREHDRVIKSYVTGTEIKAIGRDTKSADGFRSILAIVDEYHAHPNSKMYQLLLDGQVNVKSALTLVITTAGFNIGGACHKKYQMCKKILDGIITKDSQFIYICEMDEDDDIWEPRNWAKASPLRMWNDDDTLNEEMIQRVQEKAVNAKEEGGSELVNFLTKELDCWVTNAGKQLLDNKKLMQCKSRKSLKDMKGRDCILGIDLSSGGDLTSIVLLFPPKNENEKVFLHHHSFMPIMRLEEHIKTDDVPYQLWADMGLLDLTTGGGGYKTDYSFITAYLRKIKEEYKLKFIDCGYDPHNAGAFISDLEFLGCDLTEITQSARSLSDATIDFKLTVDALGIEYDEKDELFSWSCSNAITTKNSFGETKIEKKITTGRIDPIDAVIDAWKLYFINKDNLKYNADDDFDDWEDLMKSFKKK
ncbi:terminase large subunit [Peptostreptococcus canis]|uniref:Terminase large subunit n=1 Tax=Peptostreptococcus canis TaxID=1159213 RepID=A0ABR6TMC6_9FIRM|nr:terminase TerL endonuclease subunit [Peptostreptococcus canis]MBC2576569.1 terminase large subunit [Peptostreptococcus canis]MBP1998756.1 phage terminase large subunit-like protein [Peptostreptococcus canis]